MGWICPRCGSTYITKIGMVVRCSQCNTVITRLEAPDTRKVVHPEERK